MLDRWGKTHDLYDTLDQDGNPVPCPERDRFYEWLECYPDRIVVLQDNLSPSRDLFVRTVFCGSDDNFNGRGLPLLWATVIFCGPHTGNEQRYSSREDALKGHQAALMLALQSPKAKSENEHLKYEKVWRHDDYRKFFPRYACLTWAQATDRILDPNHYTDAASMSVYPQTQQPMQHDEGFLHLRLATSPSCRGGGCCHWFLSCSRPLLGN